MSSKFNLQAMDFKANLKTWLRLNNLNQMTDDLLEVKKYKFNSKLVCQEPLNCADLFPSMV